jgi:hypothetical protein
LRPPKLFFGLRIREVGLKDHVLNPQAVDQLEPRERS